MKLTSEDYEAFQQAKIAEAKTLQANIEANKVVLEWLKKKTK